MSFLLGGVKKLIWGQGDGQSPEEDQTASPPRPPKAKQGPITPPQSQAVPESLPGSPEQVIIGEVLAEAAVTLFRFDRTKNVYEEKGNFTLKLIEKDQFQFELHVFVGARSMMKHSLSNEENTQFDKPKHAMMWISVLNNVVQYWKAVFLSHEQEAVFKEKVKRSLVEASHKEKFEDVYKPDDHDYVMSALEPEIEETPDESTDDDGGMDYEDEFSDEDEQDAKMVSSYQTPMRRGKPLKAPAPPSSSTKKYQRISETDLSSRGQAEKNDNLAVGLANNRTFVLRGAKVGVFKHNEDDELKYVTKIPEITTLDGDILRPDKVMLHQADHKMLLLNSDNAFKDRVFCMDLERGQVIEEWGANEGQAIRNFGPVEKYAQLTDDPTLVGVSHNGIFTLDPRISGKTKLAASKFYAAKPMMACVTANDNGQVATGSLTGEIRLFNDITKNAKTLLPGLGDAILGMDSTADGKWLLATTAKYLLVIPTEKPDDAKGRTGFDVSLGKDKPIPLKLTIHPTDLASYNITEVNFTPAKFNIGDGVSEDWIVASTGPFLVIWNFKKIKDKKDIYAYKIQWCPQTVVADQFRFNKDDQVVVTLAQDVFLQSRKPRV